MTPTIGIDNGTSGSIGVYSSKGYNYMRMPVIEVMHYAKKGGFIKRIDVDRLLGILRLLKDSKAFIERPFTSADPQKRTTMLLAQRAHEAVTICLELLKIKHTTVDSKAWQKNLGGVKTTAALKKSSKHLGLKMFPNVAQTIKKQGDADGLFIAYHYHGSLEERIL